MLTKKISFYLKKVLVSCCYCFHTSIDAMPQKPTSDNEVPSVTLSVSVLEESEMWPSPLVPCVHSMAAALLLWVVVANTSGALSSLPLLCVMYT